MKELKETQKVQEYEIIEGVEGLELILPDGITYVKPYDQMEISSEELKKEVLNTLSTIDPKAITDSVHYAYRTNCYENVEPIKHMAEFISTQAHLISLFSDDQDEEEEGKEEEMDTNSIYMDQEEEVEENQEAFVEEENEEEKEEEEENEEEDEDEEEEEEEVEEATQAENLKLPSSIMKPRKMKNQFDFRDRATQTFYMRAKDKEVMTEETPFETISGTVNQWSIYDVYLKNWETLEKEKQKEKKTLIKKEKKSEVSSQFEVPSNFVDMIVPSLKIIERMIQLNIHSDIAYDFRYFEDEADEFHVPKGTLLPLWRFRCRDTRKMVITCLSWNHRYPDMFAVGLGSYNFMEQSTGKVVFYSLANPSYPEFAFNADSGVMSLDINPLTTYLVVVGLYDGNVSIYNLLNKSHKPWITSSCYDKHTDPVWQVRWLGRNLNDHLILASISSDGLILLWSINKNILQPQRLMTLICPDLPNPEVEGTHIDITNGGLSFDFHPTKENLYVVGTKEGEVMVCNRQHTNTSLITYKAHCLSVYKVQWNDYHPDIFISCSADWTIKIWDISVKTTEPMFVFDLGCSVEDVAWAPYSSTTFAAVTSSGYAFVFDMKWDKTNFLCEQHLVARKRTILTSVSFNSKYPILLIGDDKGAVTTYKISPNLRNLPKKDKKAFANDTQHLSSEERQKWLRELEFRYLENIISMSRIGAKSNA